MKQLITTLAILLTLSLSNALQAQMLEKKAFKEASTIRLYVTDATESAAVSRFTEFINKTSWTVQPSSKPIEEAKAGQSVNTMLTDTGSLFDFMMGEFRGQLQFYADTDSSNKIYIGVSGYTSTVTWGGSDKAKMKKGGPDTNWSQRAMFKQMDKHLSNFSGLDLVLYSDE
ncbi:hypothetical protein G3O08_20270 [Cryomorpha ignava]|uniref:DUF4468 domain-containing protein n=1 Tax=Cryomorpha ignava TaxID=101383 RepID=A0A7K3WVV6_9FLAO|nr:hypothetical protein [Cryomorpha ignava]NEN25829.1 hypothetical protein [Cryomorpha ignava]